MKQVTLSEAIDFLQNFLTHTVQMKLMDPRSILDAGLDFLTHTVQMKLILLMLPSQKNITLLNPHGSDETSITHLRSERTRYFLTHTVQMKLVASDSPHPLNF